MYPQHPVCEKFVGKFLYGTVVTKERAHGALITRNKCARVRGVAEEREEVWCGRAAGG